MSATSLPPFMGFSDSDGANLRRIFRLSKYFREKVRVRVIFVDAWLIKKSTFRTETAVFDI